MTRDNAQPETKSGARPDLRAGQPDGDQVVLVSLVAVNIKTPA